MSRRDSTSLNVRGVPRELLDALDRVAEQSGRTRNAFVLTLIGGYANGQTTPGGLPLPWDPGRVPQAQYPDETASLAISGVAPDAWKAFLDRARREGWHSKNALIVELLRSAADTPRRSPR